MIRRLRALVKKGDLEFVLLDLNELVREVARLMQSDAIGRGISLGLELAADLPTVRGDRVQLQQVVLNLVLNGLDAMHESGAGQRTLIIRTARDVADAVAVSVQDAGTGIDERNVDQLFHPLFTTKTEGLGMGLAIARTIVDAHGGRLSAANNVTAGATFQFSLPVSRERRVMTRRTSLPGSRLSEPSHPSYSYHEPKTCGMSGTGRNGQANGSADCGCHLRRTECSARSDSGH